MQKPSKEQLLTIDLIYSVVQPSRSTCYDHLEDAEIEQENKNYHCDECNRHMNEWYSRNKKNGLCDDCFTAMMM